MGGLKAFFSEEHQDFDLAIENGHFVRERGIETYEIISLYTDRRAPEDAVVPGDQTDRGGWWGDQFDEENRGPLGSHLWLLGKAKRSQQTLLRARQYAGDSLKWMKRARMASSYEVTAEYVGGFALIKTRVYQPRGKHPFETEWKVQLNGSL